MAVTAGEYPQATKDWWDKFKYASWFILSLATLVWTVLSWWLVRHYEERTALDQARAAIETRAMQREVSGAQLAAALIPNLTKGSNKERKLALLTLAAVAPDLGERVAAVTAQNAQTAEEKKTAQEATDLNRGNREAREFLQKLGDARTYFRFQLYAQADREFMDASTRIPARFSVERRMVDDARSAYSSGRFFEAARLFEEAFRSVSDS